MTSPAVDVAAELAALRGEFPGWQIDRLGSGRWYAMRPRGVTRYGSCAPQIVTRADTAGGLRKRLEAAQ